MEAQERVTGYPRTSGERAQVEILAITSRGSDSVLRLDFLLLFKQFRRLKNDEV